MKINGDLNKVIHIYNCYEKAPQNGLFEHLEIIKRNYSSDVRGVENVYDNVADFFNNIFTTSAAVEYQASNLKKILEKCHPITILDCACGTGIQSIGLLQEGYKVTSVDISAKMLRHAERNALNKGLMLETYKANFRDLNLKRKFDMVICLGNALSHMMTEEDVKKSLRSMLSCLDKDGNLLIGINDYDVLLMKRPRHVICKNRIKYQGSNLYSVIYIFDYLNDSIRWNVIWYLENLETRKEQIIIDSMECNPIRQESLISMMKEVGLGKVDIISGLYVAVRN